MRLVLYQPDIPQNTGTILRLAACMNVPVDIIGPTGFDMTVRALKRAGLDYLDYVTIVRHSSYSNYMESRREKESGRLILLTTGGDTAYSEFVFQKTDSLLLGRESSGAPEVVHKNADARLLIPMQPGLRSLNIAVAAAMVLGEALRQTDQFPRR